MNYFASVSLDSGGEMCENVTYLGNNVNTVSSTALTTCYGLLVAMLAVPHTIYEKGCTRLSRVQRKSFLQLAIRAS